MSKTPSALMDLIFAQFAKAASSSRVVAGLDAFAFNVPEGVYGFSSSQNVVPADFFVLAAWKNISSLQKADVDFNPKKTNVFTGFQWFTPSG